MFSNFRRHSEVILGSPTKAKLAPFIELLPGEGVTQVELAVSNIKSAHLLLLLRPRMNAQK